MKMKRILLALVAVATIGIVSCKKEQGVKPSAAKTQKVMGGDKTRYVN